MSEYFQLAKHEHKKIKEQIRAILRSHKEIVFAYLYGSFVNAQSFKDIDIAIFVDPKFISHTEMLDYELQLGTEIVLSYPVDIRVLNSAPLGFQNNVACSGELLFSQNDEILAGFLEKSSRYMLENGNLMRESLMALVS